MFNELSLLKRNEKCLGNTQSLLCHTFGAWPVEGQYLLVDINCKKIFLSCNIFPHISGYDMCLLQEDKWLGCQDNFAQKM